MTEKKSTPNERFKLPERWNLRQGEENVWGIYITLADEYKPVSNLGLGFPDFAPPDFLVQTLIEVANDKDISLHQYTRGNGHRRLVVALAKLYSYLISKEIDPLSEFLITIGGYEALYCAICGNVEKGDEVIIIEPFFECYEPVVHSAGGIPKFVPIVPNGNDVSNWKLDEPLLEKTFNEKTKMIIFNTPHNPTGKVFSKEEMEKIAELCKKYNAICIADEVYEWIIFPGSTHVRMCTLPGMWERTITIGSAGKAFSVTGWKTGWAYGPKDLMNNLFVVHSACVDVHITPIQEALARAIENILPDLGTEKFKLWETSKMLVPKREYMGKVLTDIGMVPIMPQGGYFFLADWTPLKDKVDLSGETDKNMDYKFTKWLTKNVGVLGIPPSAFYTKEHQSLGENYIRLCFIKTDENLERAGNALRKWAKGKDKNVNEKEYKSGKMSETNGRFKLPERWNLRQGEENVWGIYITLADEYKPVSNLGVGFPDFAPPDFLVQTLIEVANDKDISLHQYTRGNGHRRLVVALAKLYSHLISKEIDPLSEFLITVGGYEALYCAICGNVEKGDEVIIIEPFFECYEPVVHSAGGIPKFVPIVPNGNDVSNWKLDEPLLEKTFNEKTKMIIFNTPHNPTGKVFSKEEMEKIAELCKKYNAICIADEVYEWIIFPGSTHVRMCTLPGMWERTITIGSAGKAFNVTGWKTGWAYGPKDLMNNLFVVHSACVDVHITPIQEALARAIENILPDLGTEKFKLWETSKMLVPKREYMGKVLTDIGMVPIMPQGGYFFLADWTPLKDKVDLSGEPDANMDYKFTKWLTKNVGVLGIPPSAFYTKDHKSLGENYIRLCFIKTDENLERAGNALRKWARGKDKKANGNDKKVNERKAKSGKK